MTKVAALVMFAASERPTQNGLTVRVPTANDSIDPAFRRAARLTPTTAPT